MPARQPHSDDVIASVLREAARAPGQVAEILARHKVPLRTYQHWVQHFGRFDAATIRKIRQLEARQDELSQRVDLLARDLEVMRVAMGKPWRRSRSGARPSSGPSETPE